MRAVLLILPLMAVALALPAVAGEPGPSNAEGPAPSDVEGEAPAVAESETPAQTPAETKPSAWEQWISTHAYDPILRRWVAIPEGVTPGPKSGYIWNLGRWELVKIVYRRDFGWGYYDERGHWHGQDERRPIYRDILWKQRDYLDTVPRDSFEEPTIARTIDLDALHSTYLQQLLDTNRLQEIMLDEIGTDEQSGAVVSYEPRKRAVSLSGRESLVAKLATLITDESTYKAYTTEQAAGNVVEVLSIVELRWLEAESEPALNVADLNFSGLLRLLGAGSDEYRRRAKAVWFNEDLGTVTLIDAPDTVRKVREYLAAMPYAPKPDRMTTGQ
jgi:hypothetical protein